MFEPLLYFVLTYSDNFLGISITVSRILQFVVLLLISISFFLKLIYNKNIILVNNVVENKYLIIYFILLIFAAFIGMIYDSYNLPKNFNANIFIENPYFKRSLFEYFILLFNIFYFVLLPSQLLKTKIDFDYLFSVFKFFLITSIIVGYADYVLVRLDIIDLVARHIRDGVGIAGRFHGLSGEPRQASVNIVFNFSFYILYCKYFNIKPKIWILSLLILSMLLTTSTSMFFGIIFFCILLIFFRIIKFSYIMILFLIIIVMLNTPYIQIYLSQMKDAWQILESGEEMFYYLKIIRGELYPLYDLVKKIQNYEFIPVIFGNGLGSASAINNQYIGEYIGIANPNSQLVRILFESGVLGTAVFIASMVRPIYYFTSNTDKKTINLYLITMLMVLGITFAIRSPVIFIYLGIISSLLRYYKIKKS
jgi:hypothetical protein